MNARLAALDTLCACLAVNKSTEHVAALGEAFSTGKIEWPHVIGLANANLVTPCLWSELRNQQLQYKLPTLVHDYLAEIHRLNTLRNQRLADQTTEVVSAFNSLDVEPTLLKGIAAIFTGTYRDAGARMLTDVDVLVPRKQAIACWKLLCAQGYSPIDDGGDYSQHHHLHPLTRTGEYAVIEIHTDVLMPITTGRLLGNTFTRADSELMTRLVTETAQSLSIAGLNTRIPCPTHRVLHCLLHAAFSECNAYRAGTLPLKSLYELALLQVLFETQIDWAEISALLDAGGNTKLLQDWVYLAHRLFGSPLPPTWPTRSHMRRHHARCRFQASLGVAVTFRQFMRVSAVPMTARVSLVI